MKCLNQLKYYFVHACTIHVYINYDYNWFKTFFFYQMTTINNYFYFSDTKCNV